MRLPCVIVFAVLAATVLAQDSTVDAGVRVAMKIYNDCKKADGFSPCLKKKAITFVDRLSRMEKLTLTDGITLIKEAEAKPEPTLTEEQLDATLPRALEAKDEALTNIVMDKVTKFFSSRSLDISVPRLIEEDEDYEYDEEARDGKIKIPKKKKGGKKKGMMGHMMMMMMGKMVALIPVAIAGLFLLAGKALITAKIALLLSGIIALKKLLAAKNGGGGGHGHGHEVVHDVHLGHGGGGHGGWQSGGGGWQAGGGGGGWQSGGGGGGWDKRSINDAQNLAYNAYKQ